MARWRNQEANISNQSGLWVMSCHEILVGKRMGPGLGDEEKIRQLLIRRGCFIAPRKAAQTDVEKEEMTVTMNKKASWMVHY